jgi:hypothetical protein
MAGWPLCAVVALVLGNACAGSGDLIGGDGDDESESGSGKTGAGSGDSGGLSTCHPPCAAAETCAADGACVPATACSDTAECPAGSMCDETSGTCQPRGACGGEELKADPQPPNLLLVVDRSCSMNQLIGIETKWELAVDAMRGLVADQTGKIRFGLSLFPDDEEEKKDVIPGCEQGDEIMVPLGDGNELAIDQLLHDSLALDHPLNPEAGPCSTPIDAAVAQAAIKGGLKDPDRRSFMLLVTDGKQAKCSEHGADQGTLSTIALLLEKDVPTFVVAFAKPGAGSLDEAMLAAFAEAGGVPNTDPNATAPYYHAQDGVALQDIFACIAQKAVGCSFPLQSVPPDPDELYVFFDDQTGVPNDPVDGWDYDAATNTITFHGGACGALQTCQVTDVDIVFGCNEPVPN